MIEADGWAARLGAETVEIGPSLTLTEVSVAFKSAKAGVGDEDDDTDLEDIVDRFAQKAVRAGG